MKHSFSILQTCFRTSLFGIFLLWATVTYCQTGEIIGSEDIAEMSLGASLDKKLFCSEAKNLLDEMQKNGFANLKTTWDSITSGWNASLVLTGFQVPPQVFKEGEDEYYATAMAFEGVLHKEHAVATMTSIAFDLQNCLGWRYGSDYNAFAVLDDPWNGRYEDKRNYSIHLLIAPQSENLTWLILKYGYYTE